MLYAHIMSTEHTEIHLLSCFKTNTTPKSFLPGWAPALGATWAAQPSRSDGLLQNPHAVNRCHPCSGFHSSGPQSFPVKMFSKLTASLGKS